MQDPSEFLDPNSELIALSSYSNTKNVLLTAIEVTGPVDEELAKRAVIDALDQFPQLRSCLNEIRQNGRYHLYWDPRPEMELPLFVSELKEHASSTSIFDAVLGHLSPRLDRDWDLFHELPWEFHLVRVSRQHHVAVPVIHHAAFDAATASEFGRRCFLKYQELLTGMKDDSASLQEQALSTSRKRMVKVRKRTWEDLGYKGRIALTPIISRPALPLGTGMPEDKRQYHIKRVLSADETARIARSSLKGGGALIDLLAASGNLAIDRWNQRRNAETGRITTALTVNTKGRYQSLDHLNNVSALFFQSDANDRKDLTLLLRSMSTARIKQFRKQMDLKHYENTALMIGCASLLPFQARQKIVHLIPQRHQYPIAITLLGVVWPVMKDGKRTFDSYPTHVRDTYISEIHGTGYKHLTSTPLVVIAYFFQKKLNLVIATSASLFTRGEGEAFADLFVDVLGEGTHIIAKSTQ